MTSLSTSQLGGHACTECAREYGPGSTSAPAGYSEDGRQLFACSNGWGCSGEPRTPSGESLDDFASSYSAGVALRVRRAVEESGRALPDISAATGTSLETLTACLSGEQPWLADDLVAVAGALKLPVSAAFFEER